MLLHLSWLCKPGDWVEKPGSLFSGNYVKEGGL